MTYFVYHQGRQIAGNLLSNPLVTYEDALEFIKQHALENLYGLPQTYDIYESTDFQLMVVDGGFVLKKVGNKVRVKTSITTEIDND